MTRVDSLINWRKWRGFSLLEVMLVTALLAVLMTLAAPGYQAFKQRPHRTAAVSKLLGVANCQERLRTVSGRYDANACLPTNDLHYVYRYESVSAGDAPAYRVVAEPTGRQASDPCGVMILDQDGGRDTGAGEESVNRCWGGR